MSNNYVFKSVSKKFQMVQKYLHLKSLYIQIFFHLQLFNGLITCQQRQAFIKKRLYQRKT